jgi:ubiquinone/menaquinone biosynthesis C-methylase UbiE
MGVWGRHVLPRLLDLAMRSRVLAPERARAAAATGVVLEIGAGSGLNLPFYGPAVSRLCAVDPSLALWRLARGRVARAPFPVWFVAGAAEALPVRGGRFDTVVTTWTLCSVADPVAALAEIRRALAPNGRLLFVEHGRAPAASVRAWQHRLTPVWRRVSGGCHLDRPIDALLARAGFTLESLETGYLGSPRPFTYLFRGAATVPAA